MRSNISSRGFVPQIFKGVTIALLITLVSVLIFAFILSAFDLTDKVIMPINQIIKTVSILVGVILSVREGKFSLKGGL
ncbi:MAG: TIGR04086 family membrane protein [Clostridia bacterium]|nr:TIGR04086 family membrane protein [Clostridia bacterium]